MNSGFRLAAARSSQPFERFHVGAETALGRDAAFARTAADRWLAPQVFYAPYVTKRPGISEVAEAAGVSITTVSHAMSGKGRLPAETRERVRRVAAEIGYQPSLHARGLATGRTMMLAIQASGFESRALVPQLGYFVDLVNAASTKAFELGFALVLAPPGAPADQVGRLAVDGAAIIDPVGDEPLLHALGAEGKPVVTTGRVPSGAHASAWVDNDHAMGARMMMDHFMDIGCERPALLTGGVGPSYIADARAGYKSWCSEHGIRPRVVAVRGRPTRAAAARAVGRVLEAPNPPDAVYATLDTLAIGALQAARGRSVKVPARLAIGAITDSELLRATTPAITALDLHPDRIGASAIELLVALVEGRVADDQLTIPMDLLPRTSTSGPDAVAPPAALASTATPISRAASQ